MPGRQPEHPAGGTWWRRLLAAVGLARPHCGAKPTPAEDMAVAYRAVSDGDLPHAAFHVACALYAGDPNDRKALALLDRLVSDTQDSGGDPLALAPLKRDNYAGTVAVRARILAHLGQYREAFNLLARQPRPSDYEQAVTQLEVSRMLQRRVISEALKDRVPTVQSSQYKLFMNETGVKTTTMVAVVATTARPMESAPSSEAR